MKIPLINKEVKIYIDRQNYFPLKFCLFDHCLISNFCFKLTETHLSIDER